MLPISTEHVIVDGLRLMEDCRKKLFDAERIYDDVSEPILHDYSLIPYLYRVFYDITGEERLKGEIREIFVFLVVFLYAPGCLDNIKLPPHLRMAIANVLDIRAASVLSRIKESIVFRYELYFHDKADDIFALMVNRLREDGYL